MLLVTEILLLPSLADLTWIPSPSTEPEFGSPSVPIVFPFTVALKSALPVEAGFELMINALTDTFVIVLLLMFARADPSGPYTMPPSIDVLPLPAIVFPVNVVSLTALGAAPNDPFWKPSPWLLENRFPVMLLRIVAVPSASTCNPSSSTASLKSLSLTVRLSVPELLVIRAFQACEPTMSLLWIVVMPLTL